MAIYKIMEGDNEEFLFERKQEKVTLKVTDIKKCCEQALEFNPKNVQALYTLGKCCIEIMDLSTAAYVANTLNSFEKKQLNANIIRGHIFLKRGFVIDAYKCFFKAYSEISYKDSFLIYGISMLFEYIGNYGLARKWYLFLIKQDIEDWKYLEVIFRLGVCYKNETKLKESLKIFNVLLNLSTEESFRDLIKIQIAHVYEKMGNYRGVYEVLDALVLTHRNEKFYYRLLGWTFYKIKEFNKIKTMDNNRNIEDAYVLYLLGRVYSAEGDFSRARDYFLKSTKRDKNIPMVYNSLGIVSFYMNDIDKSIYYFQEAIKIKNDIDEVLKNLNKAQSIKNDIKKTGKEFPLYNNIFYEILPDVKHTKYLESQGIFEDIIFYGNSYCDVLIQELSTLKMEGFII